MMDADAPIKPIALLADLKNYFNSQKTSWMILFYMWCILFISLLLGNKLNAIKDNKLESISHYGELKQTNAE